MKKLLVIAAIAALTAMAGTAMAAATADLDVSATVIASCSMTGGSLAFGELDPTNPVEKTSNSNGVTVTCTNGTTYALAGNDGINADGTQKRLTDGSGNYIPYTVTIPGSGSGTGLAVGVTIGGTIAANTYNTAPAGSYTDTIELSVTP